jgi:hypothetical protein
MLSLSLAQELSESGYNLLLQSCSLRPLDLIGYDQCRHFLVGSLAQLVQGKLTPSVSDVAFRPIALPTRPFPLISTIGAKLVESFLTNAGVDPFRWDRLVSGKTMSIRYDGWQTQEVHPEELDSFLRIGSLESASSILNDFVFCGGGLFVITGVIRAAKLNVEFEPSPEPVWTDFQLLRDSLIPDVTPMFLKDNIILLEAAKPATLAIQLIPLAMSEEMLTLYGYDPTSAPLYVSFDHNIVPWLESYTLKSGHSVQVENPKRRDYVLLPDRGLTVSAEEAPRAARIFEDMERFRGETTFTLEESPDVRMLVLDSVSPLGPKLVRMGQDSVNALQGLHIGIRSEPLIQYEYSATPAFRLKPIPGETRRVTIRITCIDSGAPIEGAEVVVVTDWKSQYGESAKTDSAGEVHLPLGSLPVQAERIYVRSPDRGYWGAYRNPASIVLGYTIALTPIDPGYIDSVRHVYGSSMPTDGVGVRLAIIDCGVGPHPDLILAGGKNIVYGENENDFSDNGDGHGTHVAGIIAGRGIPSGIAPGVELYSYRVVGSDRKAPDNFLLCKALIYACDAGCEVANLSMGLDQGLAPHDETLKRAIEDTRNRGCIVIAAAGNRGNKPVTLLAKYASAEGFAVSAVGHKGSFPPGSIEASDIQPGMWGTDPNDFVAAFSNFGDDVSLTAPGVGVISTVPNGGYRALSGTSMAAPVVSGLVARVIQRNSPPLPPPRDRNRTREILNRTVRSARKLGFPREREGAGMPC